VMNELGDFKTISYQFNFIAKYERALNVDNGYEELILLPAPLNYAIIPMLIVTPSRSTMKYWAKGFSKFIFWFENCFMFIAFWLYLAILSPIVILKTLLVILKEVHGYKKMLYFFGYFFMGPFHMIYVTSIDICLFMTILCSYSNPDKENEEEDKRVQQIQKVSVYRDLHQSLICLLNLCKEISMENKTIHQRKSKLKRKMTMTNEFQMKQKMKRDEDKMKGAEESFRASSRFILLAY
jgi:hypothetical protein